ncbi:MAG: GntR family transcriptional regulator [Hyphomicrobiales bacterium]
MNDQPTIDPARPTGRGLGAFKVYSALRESILRLEIAPGELLDEARLGRQFQLSRSPVREALIRLASEGLVTTLPNKSTMVTPLRIEEFPDYIDALDLVQRVTTRLAADLRTPEHLETMRGHQNALEAAVADGDVLAMIETNRNFHLSISEAAGNRYLTDFHARLLDEGRRFLRLYFRALDDTLPAELNAEHIYMIEAIEARDGERAERLAHQHTIQVSERFLAYLGRRRTADIPVAAPA